MSMATDKDRRDFRRQVFFSLGGIGIGLVIAGLIALFINLAVMLLAKTIAAMLARFNVLGALIRITGLIVMTMGVQMTLDGAAHWIREILG